MFEDSISQLKHARDVSLIRQQAENYYLPGSKPRRPVYRITRARPLFE
jgi:hypothetical protein